MSRAPTESAREALGRRIFEVSHLEGDFVLRSGAVAHEYFDKYRFESPPDLLRDVARALAPLVPGDTELLAGLELGGVPLAAALSLEIGLPAVYVRKKAKEHGTRQLAEGADVADRRLCVVEDVVTSGGQIVLSTADLRERGAHVAHAVCVIDRESGGPGALAEAGVELRALFRMSELQAAAGRS